MGKGNFIGIVNNPSNTSVTGVWNLFEQYNAVSSNTWFVPISLVTSGLILRLDAGDTASYPGTGTTWTDLSGSGYNFTVQSGSWVSAGAASYFNFSGSFSCAKRVVGGVLTDVPNSTTNTLMVFSSILNSTSVWRTLVRGASGDHQVIIQQNGIDIGMYDNDSGQYLSSAYNVTGITNYTTVFNCLHFKLSQSSPQWTFGWNNNFNVGSISNVNATNNRGFASIGAYHNGTTPVTSSADASQYWGNVALVLYYNRTLTDAEITQNYNFYRGRYGL